MQIEQGYAKLLRPIGQMLEGLRIDSFVVRPDRNGFVVRDKTRNRTQLTPREKAFLAKLHLGHAPSLDKRDALRLAAGVLEWHVTANDLEQFERQGRQRRRDGERAPDCHSVSHVLRIIGAILDQRRARMCCILKDEQIVTLEYKLPGGRVTTEVYSVPALYDFWVRMYKRRAPRADARLTA